MDHFGIQELCDFVPPAQQKIGIAVQYNLGTIEEPRAHFSVYIFFDLNNIENQSYTIAAIFVPSAKKMEELKPELTYPFELKKYSYGDVDINQELLKDITGGINSLNARM